MLLIPVIVFHFGVDQNKIGLRINLFQNFNTYMYVNNFFRNDTSLAE